MSWQLVHLTDVVASAWRNGGGVTRELLAWPNPMDWLWRISVAEVCSDSIFSCFEGVQRSLAILDGAGVRLGFAHARFALTQTSAPLSFDGAATPYCELIDGHVRDLNLMVRTQASLVGTMHRIKERHEIALAAGSTIAVYANTQTARVQLGDHEWVIPCATLAWQTLTFNTTIKMVAKDAIILNIRVTKPTNREEFYDRFI